MSSAEAIKLSISLLLRERAFVCAPALMDETGRWDGGGERYFLH